MTVDNLTLEVTRRCNMNCAHCLRGDAQCIDMSRAVIDRVLQDVDAIGEVFFTGGEPSLNIPIMDYFFEQVIAKQIYIGSFGLVTNGKENQKKLAAFVAEHSADVESPEYCYVAMSRDQYHDPVEKNYLKVFSFYSQDKEHGNENWRLLSEGRATKLSSSNPVTVYPLCVEEYDGVPMIEDTLYISANGNVLSCCDLSYDHGDQIAYGNVLDEPLIDIARREIDKKDEGVA